MTPEQRDQLIDNYAWTIVDGMDIKALCQLAAEQIAAGMENYSDEEVIAEVKDYYPHLLED
jgi:hypothetical protein